MADQANRSTSSGTQNNLVSQLCRLAESLQEQNNNTQRRAESSDNRTETVAAARSRLFPSVNSSSSVNSDASPAESTFQGNSENNALSSRLPRFEPRRATPNQSNRRKPYAKGQSKKKSTGSAVIIKDVILLPNPRMHSVPRGRTREDLYVRGFVSTAFSITNEMTSSQVENEFAALFASKLNGRPFKIVRAVGSKIVDVNLTQGINGKILKHICGQGPVYLRCVRPTDTGHSWVEEDESEDDDVADDDNDNSGSEDLPDSGLNVPNNTSLTPIPVTVTSNNATEVPVSSHRASTSNASICQPRSVLQPTSSTSFPNALTSMSSTVACPTCHAKFPLSEIEQHADQCCERISSEASLYGTWVLDSIDLTGGDDMPGDEGITSDQATDDQSQNDIPSSSGSSPKEPKELIQRLSSKISDTTQLLSIRRKFLWDDYVNCRKKPWFKKEAWLRIHFVGEEAVDGGGPRREFFTGKLYVPN